MVQQNAKDMEKQFTYIFILRIPQREGGMIEEFSEPIRAASIQEAEEKLNGRTNFKIFSITK